MEDLKMKKEKNVNAINKIIGELSLRDYQAAARRTAGRVKSYSLGADTLEAIETKKAYLQDDISEAEYKRFCLLYNLTTR